jgi:hypothetical protein
MTKETKSLSGKEGAPMKVKNILADGTAIDSMEGVTVPRCPETETFYRFLEKLATETKERRTA